MTAFRRSILAVLALIGRHGHSTGVAALDACFKDVVSTREPLVDALLALEEAGLVKLFRLDEIVLGADLTPAGLEEVPTGMNMVRTAGMVNWAEVTARRPD